MKLRISKDGVWKTEKRDLNFIEGAGIDITIVDGAANDNAEITITATGAAAGNAVEVITFSGNVV